MIRPQRTLTCEGLSNVITVITSEGKMVLISDFHTGKQIREKKQNRKQDDVRTTDAGWKILLL